MLWMISEQETMIDKWGCSSDVETHYGWIVYNKILYIIQFNLIFIHLNHRHLNGVIT